MDFLDIKDVDNLIHALQVHRQQYGNLPVRICLSGNKEEGDYDIDAVLYSTDEDGDKSIDLIIW